MESIMFNIEYTSLKIFGVKISDLAECYRIS